MYPEKHNIAKMINDFLKPILSVKTPQNKEKIQETKETADKVELY